VHVDEETVSVRAGGHVQVECSTSGYPTPSLEWTRDGETIEAGTRTDTNVQRTKVRAARRCVVQVIDAQHCQGATLGRVCVSRVECEREPERHGQRESHGCVDYRTIKASAQAPDRRCAT